MNTGADNFRAYRSLFNIASGSSSMPLPEEVTSDFPISDGTGRHKRKILGLIELDSAIKDICQSVGNWREVVNAILVTTQPPSTEGMYLGPFK